MEEYILLRWNNSCSRNLFDPSSGELLQKLEKVGFQMDFGEELQQRWRWGLSRVPCLVSAEGLSCFTFLFSTLAS